jgi:hypothetical protein
MICYPPDVIEINERPQALQRKIICLRRRSMTRALVRDAASKSLVRISMESCRTIGA